LPVRAVFFDLGGTLFRYGDLRERFDALLQETLARHRVEAPPDEVRSVYRETMARAFARYASRSFYLHRDLFADAHAEFLSHFGVRPETGHGLAFYDGQSALGLAAVRPRREADATLRALRSRGLHLAVVSNIDDDQFHPLWQQMGLASHFDATTTSEEARSCKPDAGIFRAALAKAEGVEPREVVFVGDSPFHDVAGARALGMTSVLIVDRPVETPEEQRPHHEIRELSELLRIVEP
jgi:putative hydrolase of the HAD superfamily